LSWDLSQETVEKDFAECGEFARCSMPKNEEGKPRGIAFIQFNDEEGVKKALEFNEQEYGGRTIYVQMVADAATHAASKGGKDGKGKDGKDGKDGKGKDKGKGKGKDKGKKGGLSDEGRAARDGAMVESTGKKSTFADSDNEEEAPPKKKAKVARIIGVCNTLRDEVQHYRDRQQQKVLYVLTLVTTLVMPTHLLTGVFGQSPSIVDGKPVVPGLGPMEEKRGYLLFWGESLVLMSLVCAQARLKKLQKADTLLKQDWN
ncbi:unnamed protein product, partial [Polarella glacialis]